MLETFSPTASYFEILDAPVAVDDVTLTRKFRELSRKYHPDRWATADTETQAQALDASAFLNDAYRTLRDPFTRAEYLLRRERGVNLAENKGTVKPPQELFAQVLELQEALMEFREAQMEDDDATIAQLRPTLESARTEFESAYQGMADRLQTLFVAWDAETSHQQTLDALAEVIGTRGYLRRVLGNLNDTLR
jgi:molecular chaperone HscB